MSDSQSPRAKRSSTNDPEAFSKGSPQQGMNSPSTPDPAHKSVQWENPNTDYLDGGGKYSKPRRK